MGDRIYQDKTGYIEGFLDTDGYWWIDYFVIYPKFRGKGLARNLAKHIPRKAKLLAWPMYNLLGKKLNVDSLVKFYRSLGFKLVKNKSKLGLPTNDTFMYRSK